MAGDDCFFDDFKAKAEDEPLLTEEDFQRLQELFLDAGLSLEELHARYRALFEEVLGARGKTVEWAQARHAQYPYVLAYADASELELLRGEAAAARKECGKLLEKEEWVPPPPDEEPETAADYE